LRQKPSTLLFRSSRLLMVDSSGGYAEFRKNNELQHNPYDQDSKSNYPVIHVFSPIFEIILNISFIASIMELD